MKILKDVDLSKYTTVRIGGTAKEMLIPESVGELCDCINGQKSVRIMGGGSNLLIAERIFETVIHIGDVDDFIDFTSNGMCNVGCSVRLQKLINAINERGYGGIEYLYSVPGLIGGAVAMNAGRGKAYNKSISDFVVSVDAIIDGEIKTLKKEECCFEYRDSLFKKRGIIITSVLFRFEKMDSAESDKLKKERLEFCRETQDNSKPNFGSVFSECNSKIMSYIRKHGTGRGNVYFSEKTSNWILNDGGTFKEAINSIKKVEFLHRMFLKKCKREIVVWE